jgi:hypothetical protein
MPISRDQIVAKFLRYSKGAVAEDKAAAFAASLMDEKETRFSAVWAHLV